MKTISLIAVSTLLGSAVSGQMIAPQKADQGSDFQEVTQPRAQEFPVPKAHAPVAKAPKAHAVPAKAHAVPHRAQAAVPHRAEEVVHVTKTKTQIIYPTPNERLWKNLPTLPAHKHRGKVVAEFYVDDKGHYQEIKHGHHHGLRYTNSGNQDEYHKIAIDGAHPHGKVVYGGPWGDSGMSSHKGGYKHKESIYEGKEDNNYHQHGKNSHEEHKKGGSYHDSKSHEEYKKGDSHNDTKHDSYHESGHDGKDKSGKKHEKDSQQTGKNKNDWKKKTAEGYQAKGIDDIIAQNNVSTPIDMGASGSAVEGALSASISGSASAAQKTPASAMAGASAKNAAASPTAASHASSASAKPSTSTASGSTNAASNTRQVALSFVAVVAATAVWCLA
ncbi:hypothetical protein BCR42DRAFT_497264 [Absidia repens]|uniref:Uncharacterized protein n=1 Tax=Absidia repens TaxID=90262 RepID=A0A1X2HKS1_9FUNG|nr:hypothetical protein BCR42DRAFT_497264 [Absidia repens]